MVQLELIIRKLKNVKLSENKFDIDNLVNTLILSNNILPPKREVYPCEKRD